MRGELAPGIRAPLAALILLLLIPARGAGQGLGEPSHGSAQATPGCTPGELRLLPGLASFLAGGPEGGGERSPMASLCLTATGRRTAVRPHPAWVALAWSAGDRAHLSVFRWQTATFAEVARRQGPATRIRSLSGGPHGPGAAPVITAFWEPPEGRMDRASVLEVFLLQKEGPTLALSMDCVEYDYAALAGAGGAVLHVYPAHQSSLVLLPEVLTWQGDELLGDEEATRRLEDETFRSAQAVLDSWPGGVEGDPPLAVVDAALLRARLWEKRGRLPEALVSYREVLNLVPRDPGESPDSRRARHEILARAIEAEARLAALESLNR